MPNITPNPITVIPAKTSGGSLKNAANLIGYSAAAQGPQAELWANVQKALKDAQSQLDGLANSLRAPLGIPDPIQVVDATGNLVASIGTYVNPVTNTSFSGIWAKGVSFGSDADPLTYGAVGDNTNDDTNAVQQAINTTGGILYLKPGKLFKTTSTITIPSGSLCLIYGGGDILSTVSPAVSGSAIGNNIIITDVVIESNNGGTCLSLANCTSHWNQIINCFFGDSAGTTGTGISLNANQVGFSIVGCTFDGGLGTGVSITNQTDVNIAACEFQSGVTTPVATSGTVTYNLVGSNVAPHFGAPVLRQFAEFTGTTQTITAGAGFTNVTSCSWTASATGTWQIEANAFVQQASAAGNSTSIRFSKNGSGDSHTAAGGAGPVGEFPLFYSVQISLTSGDVIQLQCSAVTANASLLGTGNTGTTNISGIFLTT